MNRHRIELTVQIIHDSGADTREDVGRPSLFPLLDVADVRVVVASNVKDDATADDRWHLIEQQVLLRDEQARAARASDKLVRTEERDIDGGCSVTRRAAAELHEPDGLALVGV